MFRIFLIIIIFAGFYLQIPDSLHKQESTYLSPSHICTSESRKEAFVSLSTSSRIAVIDMRKDQLKEYIDLTFAPGDIELTDNSRTLIVSEVGPEGSVHFISLKDKRIVKSTQTGHTTNALARTQDGSLLFAASRFSNSISVIDINKLEFIKSIDVAREPVEVVISPDDQMIAVANLLPGCAATDTLVSANISLIDRNYLEVVKNISLANGSQSIKGLAFSGDGRFLFLSHILSRNNLPTSQIQHGWINSNAISVIDMESQSYLTSFLLDNYNRGAANPAGMILTENGRELCIALSGVHELCIIDLPRLDSLLKNSTPGQLKHYPNDLMALNGIKTRIKLNGKSPRHLARYRESILVSSYFSTFAELIDDLERPESIRQISLGTEPVMDAERLGEFFFSDAGICFQQWQSCVSCHPDARADGLNWDLLNDGTGNPKNGKSLLYSHHTPPSMITGIREDAETAVRAGIKYILFSETEGYVAEAIDSYLLSLEAVPSPYLAKDGLSKKAKRGKKIFLEAGCMDCHSGVYHTDMQTYDAGTGEGMHENEKFDVPALSEVWRTAPYLYDGRAKTMKEVLTEFNPDDLHGKTSGLSEEELECLTEYVLSL